MSERFSDPRVFGPPVIPRYPASEVRQCCACPRLIRTGARFGWIEDGPVCDDCATRIENET